MEKESFFNSDLKQYKFTLHTLKEWTNNPFSRSMIQTYSINIQYVSCKTRLPVNIKCHYLNLSENSFVTVLNATVEFISHNT